MMNTETVKEAQSATVQGGEDRVRDLTTDAINRRIDTASEGCLMRYALSREEEARQRVAELEGEWDFERVLEAEAATMGLIGLGVAATLGRPWLAMPAFVSAMVLLHAVVGPYPLLPVFRRFGVRTRDEIDREKYALKAVRGDFTGVDAEDRLERARTAWRAVHL